MRPSIVVSTCILFALGCSSPMGLQGSTEEEWDRELPTGWQFEDLWSDGQSAAEDAAEEFLEAALREWDLRVARGEDAGPEPVYMPPRIVPVIPVRVVDDATGEPVAGARIDNWWEADMPHAEPWEDLLEGSWTTDRDGWVLLPSQDHAPWYYVEAPGYGPLGEMSLAEEYRLVRGQNATLEVRDWRDRPVPGAVLDLLLGCGHTPNARCETTGPDGRLTFRCVDPHGTSMLWVRAPGCAGRSDAYGSWDDLPREDGVLILRTDPGPVLEGRVLRADGTPAAGAVVGTREAHRGPWTTAGPDGRFRLVGAQPYDGLTAETALADPVPDGFLPPRVEFQSIPGVSATVRLPAQGERRPTPEEAEEERERASAEREARRAREEAGIEEPEPEVPPEGPGVRVRVTAASGPLPLGRVGVVLVRDGDGAAVVESPKFRDGVASRFIPASPGSWMVTAGDHSGRLRPSTQRVVVEEGWTEMSFSLDPNPIWRPQVVERLPDGTEREWVDTRSGTFTITTEEGEVEAEYGLDESGSRDGRISIPATEPFAVEFRADDGRCSRVLLDGPPTGAGPAIVLEPEGRDPWVELDTSETGPREFPAARLSVLLPDGPPAAGATVCVNPLPGTEGYAARSSEWRERSFTLDDTGAIEATFDHGDRLQVTVEGEVAEGVLPLVGTIDAPGPWTLRWPSTEVTVRAVDENGVPIPEFVVGLLGWEALEPVNGVVVLRGVGSGPLRLWVGAPGCRMHDLRLLPAPGERREVVVRMARTTSRPTR